MKLFSFFILKLYCTFIYAYISKYCEICSNHTLCLYKNPGPSIKCVGYNQNVILGEDDANALVDKINERRNFIALGHSRYIPAAANMKKIRWSAELANFAQRWADQCDQSLRPDKEDDCRDLENVNVGQNIATIVGSTTGLNIKSFVETWFMQAMYYSGDIPYYNQSVDYKTNYFTQLIWAETDEVGCGRAKFFIQNAKPVLVERLICNFAPKGNIHGKPVYIIGYPATQCKNNMNPDKTFTGLCITIHLSTMRRLQKKDTEPTSSPVTSFLRIRNLYNDSATPEIDPVEIFNNNKPNIKGYYEIKDDKLKLRDLLKQSYDAVKRSYPLDNEYFWRFQNNTRNHADHYQKQKAHSRVYHGHNHKNEFDLLHPETPILDSRRFDFTTNIMNMFSEPVFRKHNINNQCTRKDESKMNPVTECMPCATKLKCTRGQRNNCQLSTDKCNHEFISSSELHTSAICPCNAFPNTYKTSISCESEHNRNNNCDCANKNWSTKPCQGMLRNLKDLPDDQLNKENDFNYYDLHPNFHLPIPSMTPKSPYESWKSSNNMQSLHRRRVFPRDRKRSLQEDEVNFRPFWQVDEYSNRNKPQLKAMRFTTLSNNRNKLNRRTRKTTRHPIKTEYITIAVKDQSIKTIKRVTEKYLSFDELLHLRKNNFDLDARRSNEENTTKAPSTVTTPANSEANTTEYTANTPYLRKKYCTRKLTCTWTAASLTDSAGSIIPGGGGNAAGSRTPPGYVDGCTRTSTCTRDYMNRNKMVTLTIEATSEEATTGDDDDYCERRSLHRRNLKENIESQENTNKTLNQNIFTSQNPSYDTIFPARNTSICISDLFRKKRYDLNTSQISNIHIVKRENENRCESNVLSYGDIYYLVSKKIIEIWKTKKESLQHNKVCLCNNVTKFRSNSIMVLTFVTKLLIINKIWFL